MVIAAAPAHAVQGPPILVACPDTATYPLTVDPSKCLTLQTALADATVVGNDTTIELLPGDYCPVTVPFGIANLTLAGAGQAAIDFTGNPTITGPEAALSTIQWDASCGSSAPASALDFTAGHYDGTSDLGTPTTVALENLAVVGGASGPATGIRTGGGGIFTLRDVLVEGFTHSGATGVGVDFESADVNGAITVTNSALLANDTGLTVDNTTTGTTTSTVAETSIAGNGTGIEPVQGAVHLQNDTIANSTGAGVDLTPPNSRVTAQNTLVGDNNPDCAGGVMIFGHWEVGGTNAANGNNLTGASCQPAALPSDDWSFSAAISAPTDLGGPTPAVPAPIAAVNAGDDSLCNATGTDQREAAYTVGQGCDIGAVDTTTGTLVVNPIADPAAQTWGTVDHGVVDVVPVTLSNTGGNLVGVSSVGVSGAGFSLVSDNCTYQTLVASGADTCAVQVAFAPSGGGPFSGSLSFGIASGAIPTATSTVTVSLSGTGGPDAALQDPPSKVTAQAAPSAANLNWMPPSPGGGKATVTGFASRYSTAASGPWTPYATGTDPYQSSDTVTGLTNGVAYYFQVGSISSLGTNWSAAVGPVTPHVPADTTSWSTPRSTTVSYGRSATVQATLTDTTTTHPIGSASVTLRSRRGTSGTFTTVKSLPTTTAGVASASVTPKGFTQYEWVYAGDSAHAAKTSAIATVKVAQVVAARLAHRSIHHGSKAEAYGTVSPSAAGKTVYLQEVIGG
jgi:hypothetical protein